MRILHTTCCRCRCPTSTLKLTYPKGAYEPEDELLARHLSHPYDFNHQPVRGNDVGCTRGHLLGATGAEAVPADCANPKAEANHYLAMPTGHQAAYHSVHEAAKMPGLRFCRSEGACNYTPFSNP